MHTVAVLAYDGMSGFELGIVSEVFGLPRPELDVPWYRLVVCAARPEIAMLGGARLSPGGDLDDLAAADTVIVPGVPDVTATVASDLVSALRAAHARGARIVSICSGAFALAAAGLLTGRRATTHWRYADLLRTRFPDVEVDADVLYVDHGDVLTSAGSAAGLDMCVHLVRLDHGPAVANSVARRLVVQPHRDGGQAQFIETPVPSQPRGGAAETVAQTMDWALANLGRPVSVADLAARAHVSARTYLRWFRDSTGTSPIRWLISQRVRASLEMLERGHPVEAVSSAVGFESPVTFRHHFTKLMRTSPSAYRRAFAAPTE